MIIYGKVISTQNKNINLPKMRFPQNWANIYLEINSEEGIERVKV